MRRDLTCFSRRLVSSLFCNASVERAVLSVVVELILQLLVSLLDVDANTDCDKEESTCDDQNDNQGVAVSIVRQNFRAWQGIGNSPIVSVEADPIMGIVECNVVAVKEGVANKVSLL